MVRLMTWNVNSIKIRAEAVCYLLDKYRPDVLALQELKCDKNGLDSVEGQLGLLSYHRTISLQKGRHGCALYLNKHKFDTVSDLQSLDFNNSGQARHCGASVSFSGRKLHIHSIYVPAGGYIANVDKNDKFGQKLDFISSMDAWLSETRVDTPDVAASSILMGDLNVAPYELDVYNHDGMQKVVSHTPIECRGFDNWLLSGNLVDAIRFIKGYNQRVYSWWTYRVPDWQSVDRGRRLDHILLSSELSGFIKDVMLLREFRSMERPSDHIPVLCDLVF